MVVIAVVRLFAPSENAVVLVVSVLDERTPGVILDTAYNDGATEPSTYVSYVNDP